MLNSAVGEDSAEEIASSDEGEEDEDEEGEDVAPDDGATRQPQPYQASTSKPRETASTAADAYHPPVGCSPADASASADLSTSPAAPLA